MTPATVPSVAAHRPVTMTDRWVARLGAVGGGRRPRVVLPEGDDPRIRTAALRLTTLGVDPLLLTDAALDGVETRAPTADPLRTAAALVADGAADACVGGAVHSTRDVLRAALKVIGLAPGTDLLSSSFLMVAPDGSAYSFGDCGVVPAPDAAQLATIAAQTAETHAALTGDSPRVGLLSFSTWGSAEHERVAVVREATARLRADRPDLPSEGELQFDAAVIPAVAAQKAPGSEVAGTANVLIFPDLGAGNIGYKMAQRWGGFAAYGPILQGLARPMNDLSRGSDAHDVVQVCLISSVQAMTPTNGEAH